MNAGGMDMQVGREVVTGSSGGQVSNAWFSSPPSNPRGLNPGQAVETTKLEYGRAEGTSGGAVKCVEIGKNTNGESTCWADTDTHRETKARGANGIRYPSSPCRKRWIPGATAGDKPEEGEDDVKSSCPLCPGRHTCYNGRDKGSRSREGELTQNPSSVRIAGCNSPA
ncbi:hypothetical protein H6P81_021365 [Aristolochia fimbriata]|uniref:Uncharacterized protein n=1 Tax=Aristolochia fimbriata TaxID=158543 RepID=A0AAV7DSS7_ARIFI|nr:hypothetical protein H6P81_021365 [Aristolochia fimbriata]